MKTRVKAGLHLELVGLVEAAAIAYHVLGERPLSLRDPAELAEVRVLIVRAIAAVAMILRPEGGDFAPLSAAEVNARLYVSAAHAELEELYIRRGDLLRAIEALRLSGFGDLNRRA